MEEASAAIRIDGPRRPARLLRLVGDERLVALVRAGDERAFEVLYDRHHRAILGFCRHMLGTREEAEDAVQQTFLSAYRALVGSAKAIHLRPWLFTIARNRCLSTLRARREHAPLETAEPSTEGLASTVERREDVRELLADVARLPEEQRAALLLAELGALDHAGIAAVLGCRREQVKALVFQARSSLAADREARATLCEDVREQLATATGGALRRGTLRRHLGVCPGCRTFKAEVARQRQLLAVALPVVPTALLKAGALPFGAAGGAAGGGAAAAGATAAGGSATGGLLAAGAGGAGSAAGGGLLAVGVAKVALVVTTAGAIAGGGALSVGAMRHDHRSGTPGTPGAPAPAQTAPALAPLDAPAALGNESASTRAPSRSAQLQGLSVPRRSPQAEGFAPQPQPGAGGNGAAARSFAQTRGGAQRNGATQGRSVRSPVHPTHPPQGSGPGDIQRPRGKPDAAPAPGTKAPATATAPSHGAPSGDTHAKDTLDSERKAAKAPAAATPPNDTQTDG